LDTQDGHTTVHNRGEVVNSLDIAPVQAAIGAPYKYMFDFDGNGIVNSIDKSFIDAHNGDKCDSPIPAGQ